MSHARSFGISRVSRLFAFLLMLGAACLARADQVNCSAYPGGVIDGALAVNNPPPDNVKIDTNCTILNYPGGMSTNFSFDNNDPTPYLVIFNNVVHTGQMSCNTVAEHKIWFTNGSSAKIQEGCQNLLIPVEKIDKQAPAATASIGVPFTYTLTIPVLYDGATGTVINSNGSLNDLHGIEITDDLNATGADLTYVSHAVYRKGSGAAVAHTFSNVGGVLTFNNFSPDTLPAGQQIIVEITVVLNGTLANAAGTTFINTAKWSFGRLIDGVFYDPLPGEWGVSQPMTIAEPRLVVSKTSTATAINLGDSAAFTINAQNTGGSAAWNTTLIDNIPAGMCVNDPTAGLSARIIAADGVTLVRTLTAGSDFSLGYSGCQLSLVMTNSGGVIAPNQYLRINYQTQLDPGFTNDGATLINVAGATQWFTADSSAPSRRSYNRTLTDGTPAILDHQDNQAITAGLSGYYFEKTVSNLATGMNPATTAAPGDRLRYRLRLFNVDQNINNITITDTLDVLNSFVASSFGNVTLPAGAAYSFNATTGQLTITGNGGPLSIPVGGQLVIEFDITLRTGLANGSSVSNQSTLTADGAFAALSDDPYVNGVASPDVAGDEDPTRVLILTPGPLAKVNTQASATIGEQFTYRLTVPASPTAVPLYDVRILDDLGLSAADLRLVSAAVVSGGSWTLANTSGSNTNTVLEDTITGIDIPANAQAVIEITVELQNTNTNQRGLQFNNSASYTYNRVNGNNATQQAGGGASTANITVLEPVVTTTKAVRFVSPAGKVPSDPATVGDILEYTVTVPNSGDATAYDVNIADTLPAGVTLVSASATAQVNGVAVPAFVADPTPLAGSVVVWGRANGDGSLDIPAGQSLRLTYQVRIVSVTGAPINNSVYVDWTSLQDGVAAERTGDTCPTISAPNDYCQGPATASVGTIDNTAIAKAVMADSYAETPASTTDPVVRVGDTVTYALTLSLQEYTTRNVVVEDALPAGMVLESFSISAGPGFTYTVAAQPTAGDAGTLRWELGDITNPPSNDGTPIDALVIQYVARVITDAPPLGVSYATSMLRDNLARLSYTGGDPALYSARLTATERVEVRQPQMRAISKRDLGTGRIGNGTLASPYQVSIASDVMQFQLLTCNDGLAPAYGVVLTDLLAPELDESDLVAAAPVVKIGTTTLVAGTDYTYTVPARGGEMQITLLASASVNPAQCVTVDYSLGFHTDLTVSKSFSNQAQLREYASLPTLGRVYAPTATAQVWMTNLLGADQLLKTLVSAAEATIGNEVVYAIRVPAVPMNMALNNVVVTDTLHGALVYESATAVLNGSPVAMTDNSVAPGQVSLSIASIPAGQQAIITLRTRVANNAQATAGTSITNTAAYTYTGMPAGAVTASTSGAFTIVEPLVSVTKTASTAAPNAGDVLTYTVTFAAAGAGAGDNFSNAFDLAVTDSLGLGLLYEPGTATLNGVALPDPASNGGDGISTAQTLIWDPANGIDIDVAEGAVARITYQVRVLAGVAPGQTLTNSVIGRWTGLNAASALERTGSGTPVDNDYVTQPATQTLTTPLRIALVKSVVNTSTGQSPGANATPGDTLRYTLVLTNESIVPVNNATLVDTLAAQFAPGSLVMLGVSDTNADSSNSSTTGGSNGTGVVDIRNLSLAAQGNAGATQTITFEATLVSVIQSGTTVLNQAQLSANSQVLATSNATSTLISSAPQWRILKTSQDVTGDTSVLLAGDTLRYTITVKNTGNENAVNATLRDLVPAFTTYVANTTRLNGVLVSDPAAGISALQAGMRINAPENITAGAMRADAGTTTANVATINFDVRINSDAIDSTLIANQGFVSASGAGSGPLVDAPSDDPATTVADDPTRDIVGSLPLVDAQKTVAIGFDANANGVADPGDVLRYTLTVSNSGAIAATGVRLSDAVPVNTSYVAGSVRLNGVAVADAAGGVSPLDAGMPINSAGAGSGNIAAGASAGIIFDVQVNAAVAAGTVISNQGFVESVGLPVEPTDADGLDTNGDQPTTIVVGSAQQLLITKEVFVVGGGVAQAGGQLEYVVRVSNTGTTPATSVVLSDDLNPVLGSQLGYVAGSATLNGLTTGVSYVGGVVTGDYAATYGNLLPGTTATLRFRTQISTTVPIGTTITNIAQVAWNTPTLTASSSASIDVGGIPGSATLSGHVWHDANFSNVHDTNERNLSGWTVDLYRSNILLGSATTDTGGLFQFGGVAATTAVADQYELRFTAPGASASTAKLGLADSVFTNGLQHIAAITATSGSNILNLNLPIDPNGVVYDSIVRAPVAGATLTMVQAGSNTPLASSCFDDPAQQNQVTLASGFYKFDVNFSDASCTAGGDYEIRVTPPATGYMAGPSRIIPPISSASTAAYSAASCAADALSAPAGYCEAQASENAPALSVPARTAGTNHYLYLTLGNTAMPGDSQIFNNHIAIDPRLDNALTISKKSALVNVSRGQIVPYVITVNNTMAVPLQDMSIVDTFPVGFRYVAGSSRVDGLPVEPVTSNRQLRWDNLQFDTNTVRTIKMLFIVGSGVGEGDYVNRAQVISTVTSGAASGEATATVRVVPDPTFDCTDVIGKVFDDANLNGVQDDGEKGLPGVRMASARGLLVKTDDHGRFHITCAVTPDEARGSNFILKVDDRTLPSGYRMTTENPRVLRATRGKMMKFSFGATLHKVVRIEMANGVFEPGTTEMRIQWTARMSLLMRELKKGPSILRVAYVAEVENESLVQERLATVKKEIARLWAEQEQPYELDVETEVFWRTGAPPERSKSK